MAYRLTLRSPPYCVIRAVSPADHPTAELFESFTFRKDSETACDSVTI
jgi:hypothetical protein